MKLDKSKVLFKKANELLVGGVNSPVRAYKAVGGTPLFIEKANGAFIWDADGNKYIDYVGSYGPHILGHNHPEVMEAVAGALEKGTCFGASCEMEYNLAELINEAFPSMQKMRFVNSGTEAVMSVIRVSRGYTNRKKIIKFSGCYHGHSDYLLAEAGSGVLTLSLPGSSGVPESSVKDTLVAPYNDIETLHQLFNNNPDDIAAVILEPVAGNMGVVLPAENFLRQVRELTKANGTLLVFDEVMT
ncbi:MAG: aminotransferase class III-fold pyridoxal phosphate-dependent enzyme, partial [Bacteroidota bacterium]|nr:aminotransferase class III-fold pyridoxal phosphate-dependent enzyme [Bacteroidota bacterium]